MPERHYFDWNATAPLAPAARAAADAAAEAATGVGLNPSSPHLEGRRARAMLEDARRRLAARVGAEPSELVFTSGATEAANMVFAQPWDHVIISALEHECVRAAAERAAAAGAALRIAPALPDGVVDLTALEAALRGLAGRTLVAIMAANNETGALQPAKAATALARAAGAATAVDAAQAFGKTDFDFGDLGADFAFLSGHKIGAPAGVGAALIRTGREAPRLILGGGQEQRRRAGTENLLGAVAFAAAADAVDPSEWRAAEPLRNRLEARLKSEAPHLVFFAETIDRLATTSCFAAPGWRAETQLMQLDLAGYAVSAGSACSSGKLSASHVLTAMGADAATAACAIRVSFGPNTAPEAVDGFAEAYLRLYDRACAKRTAAEAAT